MKRASALVLLTVLWSVPARLPAQNPPRSPGMTAPENRFRFPPEIVLSDPMRDVLKVDRKHYRLEFENDRVRVLRLKLGRNDRTAVHDSAPATIVCITDCHLGFIRPDGKVQDIEMGAGQTRWLWDDTRSEKNLGAHPVEMLFIETKPAASRR